MTAIDPGLNTFRPPHSPLLVGHGVWTEQLLIDRDRLRKATLAVSRDQLLVLVLLHEYTEGIPGRMIRPPVAPNRG